MELIGKNIDLLPRQLLLNAFEYLSRLLLVWLILTAVISGIEEAAGAGGGDERASNSSVLVPSIMYLFNK